MKYNIALIPANYETSNNFAALAKEESGSLTCEYLIKETNSLPHISVVQFEMPEANPWLLDAFWVRTLEAWVRQERPTVELPQTIQRKYDSAGKFEGVSWIEIVANKAENLWIQEFHDHLSKALAWIGVRPLNPSGEFYRPHLTLFSTRKQAPWREYPHAHEADSLKRFPVKPVLGLANNNWELIEILRGLPYS